ncbi:MAG: helix-turn-helix domain-containing protein [Gammaproteobacteria bacterium]
MASTNHGDDTARAAAGPVLLSTAQVRHRDRHAWLVEEIGRRYAKVEIVVPRATHLFNEMRILPFGRQTLSVVRSNAIRLQRGAAITDYLDTDDVFFVMLLHGRYRLQQDGRSTDLHAGDITLYDVTRPHCIDCSDRFAKIIFKAPGALVRSRVPQLERCTALRIPSAHGPAAVAASLLRALPQQAGALDADEASDVGACALELLTLAARRHAPARATAARGRPHAALVRLKSVIRSHLGERHLDAGRIAALSGISTRYANALLAAEGTSLMRYVWTHRLEAAREELSRAPATAIAEVAANWGFKSSAHFSRAFSARFGCSPRAWRERHPAQR